MINAWFVTTPAVRKENQMLTCLICFEEAESPKLYTTSCSHSYHLLCIQHRASNFKSCPYCRQPIKAPTIWVAISTRDMQLLKLSKPDSGSEVTGTAPLIVLGSSRNCKLTDLSLCLQLLFEHDADVDLQDHIKGWTPLHRAVDNDHLAAVRLLVKACASLEAADCHNRTALYLACSKGNLPVTECLLQSGASILTGRSIFSIPQCKEMAELIFDYRKAQLAHEQLVEAAKTKSAHFLRLVKCNLDEMSFQIDAKELDALISIAAHIE